MRYFRYDAFNTSASSTEFIKAEFETSCSDVINIHPYEDKKKKQAEQGSEEIELLPKPVALSSSSSAFLESSPLTTSDGQQHAL